MSSEGRVRVVAAPSRASTALAAGALVVLASAGTSLLVLSTTSSGPDGPAGDARAAAPSGQLPADTVVVPPRPGGRGGPPDVPAELPAGRDLAPLPPAEPPLLVSGPTPLAEIVPGAPVPTALAVDTAAPDPGTAPPAQDRDDERDDRDDDPGTVRAAGGPADDMRPTAHAGARSHARPAPAVPGPPPGHAYGHAIAPGQGAAGAVPGVPPHDAPAPAVAPGPPPAVAPGPPPAAAPAGPPPAARPDAAPVRRHARPARSEDRPRSTAGRSGRGAGGAKARAPQRGSGQRGSGER